MHSSGMLKLSNDLIVFKKRVEFYNIIVITEIHNIQNNTVNND